jgi:2-polyprenyl-3-methyl-5-hydroxy-6-metoxy-1,4-benzoquinol methylase
MPRYTLKPDRYSSHAQIAQWLNQHSASALPNRECVVLDVGCAHGFLGHWLAAPDFYLIGIDNNPDFLGELHPNYQQKISADIEADEAFALNRQPDVLVLADVLEHCRRPEEVLQRLCHRYLLPGASVIISLPNVAHWYMRLTLLMGRFEYAERGLLDRTHLRFFTLKTASEFCRQNGIAIQEIHATPTPLPLIHPAFAEGQPLARLQTLNGQVTRWFKTWLGYQFIFFGKYHLE